jgi:hypothetical protein
MARMLHAWRLAGLLILGTLFTGVNPVCAQTLIENSMETRFQLDLHVPDAALAPFLPSGWAFNVATQGPAKDANLRLVFIDRVTINGPDGKPSGKLGSNRLVYLVAPIKDAAGLAGQLVIGGLTEDAAEAPGPFGVYLAATTHTMQRSTSSGAGPTMDTQDWTFAAATGEHFELHVKYERGIGTRGPATDTRFYSAKTPTLVQLHKQEQMVDILRNATTNPPDRVREFSLKAGGGRYDKLFDGTEKILSWDNFVWVNRAVAQP